ncbi:hypothetical protein HYPSUDRAFT_204615 [Hypholoma sublateritium FD-334 SS-4]|uniref:Uncharacterized protein n=1 Tax=Hypholoma sublateritium (strain FD-334 SS-4) TaxID=945553 RepID=A0A0D2M800_HYPSF|nr:hypothetical protein HYPSUDRAFT_204615 [Hypholoma sublateritium FD-334 SS-4]
MGASTPSSQCCGGSSRTRVDMARLSAESSAVFQTVRAAAHIAPLALEDICGRSGVRRLRLSLPACMVPTDVGAVRRGRHPVPTPWRPRCSAPSSSWNARLAPSLTAPAHLRLAADVVRCAQSGTLSAVEMAGSREGALCAIGASLPGMRTPVPALEDEAWFSALSAVNKSHPQRRRPSVARVLEEGSSIGAGTSCQMRLLSSSAGAPLVRSSSTANNLKTGATSAHSRRIHHDPAQSIGGIDDGAAVRCTQRLAPRRRRTTAPVHMPDRSLALAHLPAYSAVQPDGLRALLSHVVGWWRVSLQPIHYPLSPRTSDRDVCDSVRSPWDEGREGLAIVPKAKALMRALKCCSKGLDEDEGEDEGEWRSRCVTWAAYGFRYLKDRRTGMTRKSVAWEW